MKTWQGTLIMAIALVSSLCGLGCAGCEDDEKDLVLSGEYVLADSGLGVLTWLDGAQMTIDREAETATIRYTREGTTYDVEFTLTHR